MLVNEIDSGVVVSGGWFEGVVVEDDVSRRFALVAETEDWRLAQHFRWLYLVVHRSWSVLAWLQETLAHGSLLPVLD